LCAYTLSPDSQDATLIACVQYLPNVMQIILALLVADTFLDACAVPPVATTPRNAQLSIKASFLPTIYVPLDSLLDKRVDCLTSRESHTHPLLLVVDLLYHRLSISADR
jgi:hypothetical protein